MSVINTVLRKLFDVVLYPVRDWPPLLSLAIISLTAGIAMLLVVKATSNQTKLAEVKRRIHAGLFEIRLFNDDLGAIFKAQGEILRHNVSYVGLTLVPAMWMLVPFVLIAAQLQFHYGYRGLEPGETTLLTVELADSDRDDRPDVTLEAPPGIRVITPAVWTPQRNELTWRIAGESPGSFELAIHLDGNTFAKSVEVSDAIVRRSPERVEPVFWKELLYPAEPPLPDGGLVRSIRLDYPDREISLFGFGLHWMIWFFILSIVFAFALRNRFGVTI
jgi:uncharacterized membrane protein (DUF106 family)